MWTLTDINIGWYVFLVYFFVANWIFYFKFQTRQSQNTNVTKATNFIINNKAAEPSSFFINFFFINLCFFLFSFQFLKLQNPYSTFNVLEFNNFNLYLVYLFSMFNLGLFFSLKILNKQAQFLFKLDYLFSLVNIFFFFCLMLLASNLYTFFFLLEVCSMFIFYKLILSKYFTLHENSFYFENLNYLNLVFFHYWVSFFSTILFLLFLIVLCYFYGSVDFAFQLFLKNELKSQWEVYFFYLFFFVFTVCFFFKLGFSPFHLFKLEIYNNLSYFFLFFYTIYYFLGFFFIFSSLYFKFLLPLDFSFFHIYLVFVVLSLFVLIFFIFDISLIKAFLAYSTIINLLNFFLLLLLITS